MNLEKDKSYSITYATKSGETKSIELTPEQDMNTPKLINYIKKQDNEFFKLLDDKTECLNTDKNLNQLEESNMDNEMLRGKDILYVLEDYTQEIGEDIDLSKFLQYVNKAQNLNVDTSEVTDWISDKPAEKIALAYQYLDEKTAMNLIKECYGDEFFDKFQEFLDKELKTLDTHKIHYIDESKSMSLRESKYKFNSIEFEKSIPHNMRFKDYEVLENSYDLFWVTQAPFDMNDLKQFQKALINDTPFAKAYVTVRDFSTYNPNEVNTKNIFAIVTFDKIDATGYMKACEEEGWLDEDEKDPSTWVINNVVTSESDSDSDEGTLTEAEDKDTQNSNTIPADTDVELDIDFEDVDTYTDEDVNSADTDTENQEEISNNIETATEEVSKEATDTDVLAVEVSNSSIDVLIADEQSAIDGYNAFLAQCKDTLLPALYNVLETEIKEIIADEEEHITKLNTIKSAFHLQATPLDESKKLNEGKIDYLKEIQNIVEQAQYNMGLDEFFKFLTDLKDYVDAKHYDNEPVDESKSIKTEVFDKGNTIFELKLDCSNEDTFDVGEMLSKNVAKELRKVADKLDDTIDQGPIMDINGNKVGSYGFGYEGVMSSLDESKEIKTESIEDGATIFEMKFDCSNEDTFGVGYDLEDSVSKVVEEVASKIKAGRLDGAIMDINGNKIGSYGLGYEGVQIGLQESKSIKTESVGDSIFELKINTNSDAFGEDTRDVLAEVSRILIKVANNLDYTDNKTILDLNGNKIGSYGFGYEGVQIGLQESKSIENYFENIDTLEALKDRVDELYDEEKIDDDKYDEVIDYLDQRIEEVDNYIEARSKVTNTDERDIAGIIEDNTIDAIKTIGKMLNESKDLDKSNK